MDCAVAVVGLGFDKVVDLLRQQRPMEDDE
jgi:hypothetical protein